MAQLRENIRNLVNGGFLTGVSGNVWRASVGPLPPSHRHLAAGIVYGLVLKTKQKGSSPCEFNINGRDMEAYYADHVDFEGLKDSGSKTLGINVGHVLKTLRSRGVLRYVEDRSLTGNYFLLEWCEEPIRNLLSSYTDEKDVGVIEEMAEGPSHRIEYTYEIYDGRQVKETAFNALYQILLMEGEDPNSVGFKVSFKVYKEKTDTLVWDSACFDGEVNQIFKDLIVDLTEKERRLDLIRSLNEGV